MVNDTINESINATINTTSNLTSVQLPTYISDPNSALGLIYGYFLGLPKNVLAGDYFAIMVAMILIYLAIVVINKATELFLVVLKKTVSLAITVLALLMIFTKFEENLALEGFTINTFLIGFFGVIVAFLGIGISFYAFFKHTKEALSETKFSGWLSAKHEINESVQSLKSYEEEMDNPKETEQVEEKPAKKGFGDIFSIDSLKNDKSILSVMTFLVVAEFGVFSTKTVSAPTIKAGMTIFVIFLLVSFLFIKQSYHRYTRGLMHIGLSFVVGTVLALILGHYWEGLEWSILLSLEVFKTDVIVAILSGMALSLFAGSKS